MVKSWSELSSGSRFTLVGKATVVCMSVVSLACQTSASSTVSTVPDPNALPTRMFLAVGASPDSALKLAKFALGTIEGTVQMPKTRPQMFTVANHYLRNRDGGGQTQVAVIAALDRRVRDVLQPVTLVELSVWVLDIPQQLTPAQRRAGVPTTAVTTNAPRFKEPRAMTPSDTVYWRSLEYVADALVQHGARRLP